MEHPVYDIALKTVVSVMSVVYKTGIPLPNPLTLLIRTLPYIHTCWITIYGLLITLVHTAIKDSQHANHNSLVKLSSVDSKYTALGIHMFGW